MLQRTRLSSLLILAVPICLATAPATGAPGEWELGGVIFDAAGERLPDVEVLLGRPGRHVVSARSDTDGRYLLRGLAPGSYLLLATKVGYRATLVQVNTLAAGTRDLTLRLLGEPLREDAAPAHQPEDEAWVLRLPSRDVLRELGEGGSMPGSEVAEATATSNRQFNAEVQQWFSRALGALDSGGNSLADGRSTEFHLNGTAAEGVSWWVKGGTGRTAAAFEDRALRQIEAETHRLLVNVNVLPDADNQVDISAWFDQADRAYDAGLEGDPSAGQRTRVWGYGAHWSRRVAEESEFDLKMRYGAANLNSLRSTSFLAAGGTALEDQYWSALGSLTFSPAEGHRLHLGMRASLVEHGSDDLRLALDPDLLGSGGPVGAGRNGWAVNVFGRETFEIAGPLALEVGLDLHHLGFDQPVSYILPQAGVTYRPGQKDSVRAVVMMKFADGGEPIAGRPGEDPSDRVGYLLAWDRQLGADLLVSVAAALRPYAQERLVAEQYVAFDPASRQALFLSDGNAKSHEVSFRLEKRIGGFHASTGLRYGAVKGSLLSFVSNDLPSQTLAYDHVRFVSTSLRTVFVPWGTQVAMDFQRVRNESLHVSEAYVAPRTYTSLNMVVQQQVSRHRGRGDWSLMVGYQAVLNASDEEGAEEELARLGVPAALRQLRGGVSVRF